MKKTRNILITVALALISSLAHLGCDGGGGNNGGTRTGQTTVINGKITNVVARTEEKTNSVNFAMLTRLLSVVQEAKAQNNIMVTAMIDGVTVDTDITGPDGSFSLSFLLESAENVTLIFDVNGTTVSINILVEEGSVIEIIVAIDLNSPPGDEVDITAISEVGGPIRCENGILEITKNVDEDFIIDGGGEDCIRTAGNCTLIIDPEDIILTNCQRCIDARGTSQVTLLTVDGDIICDATEDGIRSRGNANVRLEANGDLNVSAFENGARADGNSTISFFGDVCIFDSGEDTFDVRGNASIDTEGCGEIIEGIIPSPFPSPAPTSGP